MLLNIICTKIVKLSLKTQKEIIDFIGGGNLMYINRLRIIYNTIHRYRFPIAHIWHYSALQASK